MLDAENADDGGRRFFVAAAAGAEVDCGGVAGEEGWVFS